MTDRTDAAIDRAYGLGVMAGLSAARKSPEYEDGVRKAAERMIADARSVSRGETEDSE